MNLKMLCVSIILVIALSITMVGCNQKNIIKETGSKYEKLDNPNISVFVGTAQMEGGIFEEAVAEFEKKYGGKVDYVIVDSGMRNNQFIASYNAGSPPDYISIFVADYPNLVVRGMLQPVEKYLDLNSPIFRLGPMKPFKAINGDNKDYGVTSDPNVAVVFFNKTLFENNGVKTPMEHYKAGNWTWETLKELGVALTQDTDRDGVNDQIGLAAGSFIGYGFIQSNGSEVVNIGNDRKITISIGDNKAIEALRFYQEAVVNYKFAQFSGNHPHHTDGFIQGKSAMHYNNLNILPNLQSMKYEWDFVPFPIPVKGGADIQPNGITILGIPTGAHNPEGGAAFIHMWLSLTKKRGSNLDQYLSEDQKKLVEEIKDKSIPELANAFGDVRANMRKLFNELLKGGPVATIVDNYIPILQNEIDTFMQY